MELREVGIYLTLVFEAGSVEAEDDLAVPQEELVHPDSHGPLIGAVQSRGVPAFLRLNMQYHPYKALRVTEGKLRYYSPEGASVVARQSLEQLYFRSGACYAITRECLFERGAILCGAYITERIMPGAISSDHGSRHDPIAANLDRGGVNNLICPRNTTSKNATGMAVSGYLVEAEKADLNELMKKYPEAFKRPLHPDVGPCYESWVRGE